MESFGQAGLRAFCRVPWSRALIPLKPSALNRAPSPPSHYTPLSLQVQLPEGTNYLCNKWSISDNHDEATSTFTDGVMTMNIKALFKNSDAELAIFDYHNKLVQMREDNRLPSVPAGVDESAEGRFLEKHPIGTPQAGGFRDKDAKRAASAKKKPKRSGDSEEEFVATPKRRVVAPPSRHRISKKAKTT